MRTRRQMDNRVVDDDFCQLVSKIIRVMLGNKFSVKFDSVSEPGCGIADQK